MYVSVLRGLVPALLIAGCAPDDAGSSEDPLVDGPFTVDGPVWTTALARSPEATPASLARPLDAFGPAPAEAPYSALGKLRYQLCHQPASREPFRAAVAASPADDRFLAVTQCDHVEYCAWVHTVIDGAPESAWWWALRACHDPRTRQRIADEAPDDVFVEYWWLDTLPFHPRLVAIVERALGEDAPPQSPGITALKVLGDADGPEAESALLALFDAAPPGWRDVIALSLWGRPSERAQVLLAEVCARVDARSCGWSRSDRLDPVAWMSVGVAPERLFDRFPSETAAVVDALVACVVDAPLHERRGCARALARRAPERLPDDADPDLLGAREPALVAAQLDHLGVAHPPLEPARLVIDGLDAAGLTVALDSVGLDEVSLLYEVAHRAGLADLDFAVIAAADEAARVEGRAYYRTFYAWDGEVRYRGLGPDQDELGAGVVAFANALFEARGLAVRAALDLDRRRVVLASRATLDGLVESSLVALAPWP